jgi:ribosomal protein L18
MKLNLFNIFVLLILPLFIGCTKRKTLYFDFVDEFYESMLPNSKIAVCMAAAELRKSETTDIRVKTKGLRQYTYAVARELEEAKKCLQVMYPERVYEILPDIYNLVSPIRAAMKDKGHVHNETFKKIKKELDVDYLLIVERVTFHHAYQRNAFSAIIYQTTSLEYQIWDLNKRTVLVHAKVSSKGDGADNLLKDYNKKTAAVKIGKVIARDLPKCQKK